ncbi:hypothetical protein B0H19DRAFT_1073249 [Mycena capillaripes]|nr:hypothetical protein B0H19DRAFT_1073249 [Mycena capillaripes]
MSIQLPQELIEEIVDHLAGDFASLKACSLVCRAWVFRTRSYLFETCRLEPDNIIDFYDLLRSPDICTFLLHVRSVSADRHYWHHNDRWFNEITTRLHYLANVRTLELTLSVVNAPGSGFFLRAGFFAAFPHVTRLVIIRGDFGIRPAPLIDTICLFRALQELEILDTSGRLSDPPAGAIPPPGMNSLKLSQQSLNTILAWLHTSKHLPNVNAVTLSPMRGVDLPVVRAAMQQLGGALHHLDISPHISAVVVNGALSTVFDLSLHPNLRTLAVRYVDFPWALPEDFDRRQIFQVLLEAAPPTLEQFWLNPALPYRSFEWEALNALLSDPTRFPRLKSVVFGCTANDCEFLRGALPLLEAAGVLAFDIES